MKLQKNNVKEIIAKLTLEQKAKFCIGLGDPSGFDFCARNQEIPEFGISEVVFADGPQGLRFKRPSMCFPCSTVLANSWDDENIEESTKTMADIVESYGVDLLLAPGMNIQRFISNGRNFEYFSEDPFLTGRAATAYVNGVQKNGVGACPKHYCANSQEKYRSQASSEISERALREIYLRAFGYTVKNAKPYAIMTSYNLINGTYAAANKPLVTDVLRNEFGFDGVVTSDWNAGGGFTNMIKVQNDMFSGSPDQPGQQQLLVDAVNKGEVSMEELDRCVEHVLNMVLKSNSYNKQNKNKINRIKYVKRKAAVIRKVAAKGMVLLKNDGALPFKEGNVAIFGNGSYVTKIDGGGSGGCCTINEPMTVHAAAIRYEGIKENELVLKKYAEHFEPALEHIVTYKEGVDNPVDDDCEIKIDLNFAKKAAKEADVAMFTITRTTAEGTDNLPTRGDYLLNDVERDNLENISKAFHEKGKKLVVAINSGNPIEVKSWEKIADAIIYMGYPGEQAGFSLLDVVTGKVNPSGKLACTWPVKYADIPQADCYPGSERKVCYCEDIYVGYRYYDTFGIPVSYPFGYGLSYTDFKYTGFKAVKNADGTVTLSVRVKNVGSVPGREAAEFYVSIPDGKNEHPAHELCGYKMTRILAPGKSCTVTVTVTEEELKTYVKKDNAWIVEGGTYRFFAGKSSADLLKPKTVEMDEKLVKKVVDLFDDGRLNFKRLSKNQ